MPDLLSLLGAPHSHAIRLIFASVAAIEALVAIWAATSRVNWFWRALAVVAAVMALAPIRAYEPALTFALSSSLTVLLIRLQQQQALPPQHSRNLRIRYTTHDLFLLMAVVGLTLVAVLHLLRNIHRPIIVNYALNVAALTALTLAAANCVVAKRRLLSLVLLVLVIVTLAAAIPLLGSTPEFYDALNVLDVGFHPSHFAASAGILAATLSEFALLFVGAMGFIQAAGLESALPGNITARRALTVASALVIAPLAVLYWQMLWLSPLPQPFSTGPNHYDRLFTIAQQVESLVGVSGALVSGSPAEAQRAALITEAMPLADAPNYVPSDSDPNPNRGNLDDYIARGTRKFRTLARAIEDEAGAAYSRGDQAAALELRLTNIRLGVMLQRGAEEPVYLIGRAIEGVSLEQLIRIRHELSRDQLKAVIAALQRDLIEREAPETVVARDRAIAERAYGWGCRLDNVLAQFGLGSDIYPVFTMVARERPELIRMLQSDLAIRLYQHDHGQLPQTLDKLVPRYVPALPIDLHSGKPLAYQAEAGTFLIYSVGQDGVDNGGKLTNRQMYYLGIDKGDHRNFGDGYDFDLDTLTRP